MIRRLIRNAANVPALVIGVLIGGVLLSGVAVATVPGLVTIADSAGVNKASVNSSGQLLAAESNPRNTVRVHAATNLAGACTTLYTVPAGKALIVKSVNIFNHYSGSGSPEVLLFTHDCIDLIDDEVFPRASNYATQNRDFPLGVPLPSDDKVTFTCFGSVYCQVVLIGYLVPANMVPASATGGKAATTPDWRQR
jgi:hypothetical protein